MYLIVKPKSCYIKASQIFTRFNSVAEFEQKQIKTCYFLDILSLQTIQKKLNAI